MVLPDPSPRRLDRALAAALPGPAGLSRSRLQALIAAGAVLREGGGVETEPSAPVRPGEAFLVSPPPPSPAALAPEAIPLSVVFEDAHLIVIDKPPGMVVHPAPGAASGTLVNALLHHCGASLRGIGGVERPGIVHRIDKETSGLLVVAKTQAAHAALSAEIAAHRVERRYRALAWGAPDQADPRLAGLDGVSFEPGAVIRVDMPLARHPTDRKRMAVARTGGRHAVTRFGVEARFGPETRPVAALLTCRLETGRTHQIRVHAKAIGHALVGDPVYARPRAIPKGALPEAATAALLAFPRQALHAATLGFTHPATGEALRFEAPLPADMQTLLTLLP